MLISQLKYHFPARFPEWMNAGIMASWGAYVLLHQDIFTRPPTSYLFAGLTNWSMAGYEPAAVWGVLTLVVGLIRACALFVNGAYSRTPVIRLATSAFSAFVWSQIVIGLWKTGIPNVGLVVYGWLVVIDMASAYRAGLDAAMAEESRRASLQTREGSRGRFADHANRSLV